MAVAHVDPAKVELAHELHRRFPPDPAAPQGVWNILRTGQPEIVPEITDELLVQSIKDDERLRIVRELGLKSYIGVPLKVRGKTLGVLTFIAAESGHRYDDADLAVAKDLADRAAIAIENAQLYRELREADRRKDEFLATLAHELRNPLAPIRNGLQVLRLAGASGEMVDEARAMMERQLGQMVRLVDDLLDVSRITRGKLELRKERVDTGGGRPQRRRDEPPAHRAGRAHDLTVTLPPDAGLPRRRPDPAGPGVLEPAEQRRQVHRAGRAHLADRRAAGRRGRGVGAGQRPRHPRRGAAPHLRDVLAGGPQPGAVAGRAGHRPDPGAAAGRDARRHGRGPQRRAGQGQRVHRPAAGARADGRSSRAAGDGRRRSGDGRSDGSWSWTTTGTRPTSLGMMLKLMGNETRTAHDGLEAVEAAEEFRPDVILLDIGLPKLNGYDACRRIREQPWAQGHGHRRPDRAGARRRTAAAPQEAGFDHHMVKPVEATALQRILQSASPT